MKSSKQWRRAFNWKLVNNRPRQIQWNRPSIPWQILEWAWERRPYATRIHSRTRQYTLGQWPRNQIIATNIIQEPSEDMLAIASELVNSINESVNVVAASRLKSRGKGKPGLVNISMSNLEDKKLVLIEKRKLRQTEQYKSVFLRGSKSQSDRILELNARTLLNFA